MRSFHRLAALLLALALSLSALVLLSGCDNTADPSTPGADSSSTSLPGDTTPADPAAELVLVENGQCNYEVIRYEDSSDAATAAARTIIRAIKELTGVEPQIATDYIKKGTEYDPSKLAILVGSTRYDETAQVSDGMGYGEYRVQVCGNKLVVAAPLDAGITAAANAVSGALAAFWDGERLVIPADWSVTAVVDKQVNEIPVCVGVDIGGIYDAGNKTQLLVLERTTEEMYLSYCDTILSCGYEKYSENEINGVLFSSYTSDTAYLNVTWCKPTKELRVSVDMLSATALPPREQDNVYTKVCDSSVTQIGCELAEKSSVDISTRQIGMCYIFRLADGSFIIEDGGFDAKLFAGRIYDTLVELNGGPDNIVIAAWIFSHTHGDHTGAFCAFTDYYFSLVTIESFIYNIPTMAQYTEAGESTSRLNETRSCMAKYKNAKYIIAHPGQEFYIRNAKLTTLFTYELRIPASMDHFNSSSIVLRIELEGQSFVLLGDMYTSESELLARLYGKELKCDFLQVAHHGATGGVNATNRLLDPVVLLWPLGEYDYFGVGKWKRSAEEYNRYFFESTTLREIILAGSDIVTLPLPYTFPETLVLPTQGG